MKKNSNNGKKSNTYSSYNNRPFKVPSPEEMSDDLMTFTFNPKITPLCKIDAYQLDIYYNELINIFASLRYCKVKLYHEISSTGKWHLHGYIKVLNKMKFTLFDLQYLMVHGVFEIDTMFDIDGWKLYVHKQQELMLPILNEYKVPLVINSIDGVLKKIKIDPLFAMAKCSQVEPDMPDSEIDNVNSL